MVEIMVVVAIIATLSSVAAQNYLRTGRVSSRNICISNLKQIDAAIDRWAVDNNIMDGTIPGAQQENDIYNYIRGGKPQCPAKGEYTIYRVGEKPQVRCSRESDEGHKLPE